MVRKPDVRMRAGYKLQGLGILDDVMSYKTRTGQWNWRIRF